MKKENNILQMVFSALLSAVFVFLLMGRGEKVIIVNDSSQGRAPVAMSGIIPDFNDGINWAHYVFDDSDNNDVLEPDFSFVSDDVIEIIDGDTFTVMLDLPDFHEKTECKIRLAGVNCPEQFDQVCYANAKIATSKFFLKEVIKNNPSEEQNEENEERIRLRNCTDFHIYLVDTDSNNRPVAYIVKEEFLNENKQINESLFRCELGGYLIKEQVAFPCLYYYFYKETKNQYLPFFGIAQKHVEFMIDVFEKPWTSLTSIWKDEPRFRKDMELEVDPYINSEHEEEKNQVYYEEKLKGDRIKIKFKSMEVADLINFSGYSLIDENSMYTHRFFIPNINLGYFEDEVRSGTIPNMEIFTGTTVKNRTSWGPSGEARKQPVAYMMGESNWICDNGEFIFVRNPNRKIVMAAFWDSSKKRTVQLLDGNNGNFEILRVLADYRAKNNVDYHELAYFMSDDNGKCQND